MSDKTNFEIAHKVEEFLESRDVDVLNVNQGHAPSSQFVDVNEKVWGGVLKDLATQEGIMITCVMPLNKVVPDYEDYDLNEGVRLWFGRFEVEAKEVEVVQTREETEVVFDEI